MDIIALAADHRGFAAKAELIAHLKEGGVTVLDLGTNSGARVDSQDYAVAIAKALKEGKAAKGIIICGSGNGIAMAANRFSHVRASVCPHVTAAKMARQHNDANIISLAADYMGPSLMKECVDTFLKTEFLGGHYGERVQKLSKLNPDKV